jgi:hypothetical protein
LTSIVAVADRRRNAVKIIIRFLSVDVNRRRVAGPPPKFRA